MSEEISIEYIIEGIQNFILKSQARAGNYQSLVHLLDGMQRITKNEPKREPRKGTNFKQFSSNDGSSKSKSNDNKTEQSRSTRQFMPCPRCYRCHEFGSSAEPESTFKAGSRNDTTTGIEEMNKIPLHLLKEDLTEPVLVRVPINGLRSTETILLSNEVDDKYYIEALVDNGSPSYIIS